MSSTQPEPHIIMTKNDSGQRSYALMVDGQQMAAFDTLLENLDLNRSFNKRHRLPAMQN